LFGVRVANIAPNFQRFRITRLLACWRPIFGTSTSGRVGVGFSDDPFPTASLIPTPVTPVQIDELRCSHVDSIYRDVEVEWRPIEPSTWYYVDPTIGGSAADQRLEYPGALTAAIDQSSVAGLAGTIALYYDITFEGAVDPSTGA
jgi:hypothetical protein